MVRRWERREERKPCWAMAEAQGGEVEGTRRLEENGEGGERLETGQRAELRCFLDLAPV